MQLQWHICVYVCRGMAEKALQKCWNAKIKQVSHGFTSGIGVLSLLSVICTLNLPLFILLIFRNVFWI